MPKRATPDPAQVAAALEPIREHSRKLARAEAAVRRALHDRDEAIAAALALEPDRRPTHQQIADVAGLTAGGIPKLVKLHRAKR